MKMIGTRNRGGEITVDMAGFVPEDFATDGLSAAEQKAFRVELGCAFRTAFSFNVDSSKGDRSYEVRHDGSQCLSCECEGNTVWRQFCGHMKRGTLVLKRKKARQERSMSRGYAPYHHNNGGFSIERK